MRLTEAKRCQVSARKDELKDEAYTDASTFSDSS